jgi:hypothetical protein
MKRYRCLKETNHRRTYNLVRKELYAVCSRCAWHSNFWRSCGDNPYVYTYLEDGTIHLIKLRFDYLKVCTMHYNPAPCF